jgi:hypothetical protein
MIEQKDLFGDSLRKPHAIKDKEQLKILCCEPCYFAKEKDCNCKCHGAYHGLGRYNPDGEHEKTLEPGAAAEFKKQITRRQIKNAA